MTNRRFDAPVFWGSHAPLSALTGAGLLIMASVRFSIALICAGALIWVYGLSALIFSGARNIMPRRGKIVILLFLSTFLCGVFVFFTSLLNPLLLLESGFFLMLIPPFCLGSGLYEASESAYPVEVTSRALLEAAVLAGLLLALALIREPLGMGTISFPGGTDGITELVESPGDDAFVPLRLLSVSSGGLILLGYGVALYRFLRERYGGVSEDNQ